MKFWVVVCAVASAMAGASSLFAQGQVIFGKTSWVSDGDTIQVTHDGTRSKIRFQAVDAPEVAHNAYEDKPATTAQPFGYVSKDFIFRKAAQKNVTVFVEEVDKYKRLVATIFLEDGSNLNEALVDAGMAWWYAKYGANKPKIARLEAEARFSQRGLWVQDDPEPPWIFRHPEQRSQWEQEKCQPTWAECSRDFAPVNCSAPLPLPPPKQNETVMYEAQGPNECVAQHLLAYQICRFGLKELTIRPTCTSLGPPAFLFAPPEVPFPENRMFR